MNRAQISAKYHWPRRRPIRTLMRGLASMAFAALTDLHVEGAENFPEKGPLLVVANHFNFADPALMIRVTPWPLEMLGGNVMPNAPRQIWWIARTYGMLPVYRGTGRREALIAARSIIDSGGILGVFPEGVSDVAFLREARPGVSYIATQTGCPILPMGFDGLPDIFPRLRKAKRARLTVRVGKPFGPFKAEGRGAERRRLLDEVGHEIMQHIAELIPPERRGFYSRDPGIRQMALANTAAWPF
jgi:1-acyl-sn-glycerol-3-phosphate acyltransferase